MKKAFYISAIVLLFSCSTNRGSSVINALIPDEGKNIMSWLDVFPDIEMIRLTGEQLPVISPYAPLVVRDNIYYVVDRYASQQIHRFDQNGKYLNSIGSRGRGQNEYISMVDVMVDSHGNINVYSGHGDRTLLTYSSDGILLEREILPYASLRFASLNGFNYHYVGIYSKYQLYVTDNSGQVKELFPSSSRAPIFPNFQTFSLCDNALYFCPPDGNDIYQLQNGKIEVKYRFDFGVYNIPDEYYKCNNEADLIDFMRYHTVAFKDAFYENKYCAILQLSILSGMEGWFAYGILNKQKNVWRWFNGNQDDFMFFRYLDEEYAYFTADPELMKQTPGMIQRFPLLNTLTDNDNIVILRCKMASANL